MFIHFTTAADAEAIVASRRLELSRTIVDAVYAVAVGGRHVPGVQYGGGRGVTPDEGGADAAVLFDAPEPPDTLFVEEAIWHRSSPLPLIDPVIIPVADAVAALDDSAGLPD